MKKSNPRFVISLDFELMWGVRDNRSIQNYGKNILGVRMSIPAMLSLFRKYKVKATWATVGLLLYGSKKELFNNIPPELPKYDNLNLNPYPYLNYIGDNEKDDPFHYGLSLAQKIVECDGMELASHTFSHYYCLESGQSIAQFKEDLKASKNALKSLTSSDPISLVFPRNQYNSKYLPACRDLGFKTFRGNELSWLYGASRKVTQLKRGARLADAYFPLSGDNSFEPQLENGMVNVAASRFLRPYNHSLGFMQSFHVSRIKASMKKAAVSGKSYHLWWHPHNFGLNLSENIIVLEDILKYFKFLESEYGMVSSTMGDFSVMQDDLE